MKGSDRYVLDYTDQYDRYGPQLVYFHRYVFFKDTFGYLINIISVYRTDLYDIITPVMNHEQLFWNIAKHLIELCLTHRRMGA